MKRSHFLLFIIHCSFFFLKTVHKLEHFRRVMKATWKLVRIVRWRNGVMDFANRVDSVWIHLSEYNVRGDHIAFLQLSAKLFSNTSQYLCFSDADPVHKCLHFFLFNQFYYFLTYCQSKDWLGHNELVNQCCVCVKLANSNLNTYIPTACRPPQHHDQSIHHHRQSPTDRTDRARHALL